MDALRDSQLQPADISSPVPEEELDPRIQVELDRLNYANEAINHLELQLDEARKASKELLDTSHEELFQLEKSIGSAVLKSRSYYEARIKQREAKDILTKAKHRFERAQALHVAAKELAIVSADYIDEAGISNENATAWSETYRQAVEKAHDAEREKYLADFDQQRAERVVLDLEMLVAKLEKDLRKSINKSKPYYEMKVEFSKEAEFHKRKVSGLENCVNEAKTQYQQSLKNLERISNEIHEQRKQGKSHGEPLSDAYQEQIAPTESKPIVSEATATDGPTALHRKDSSDALLRSCLLRTESLPVGVFSNSQDSTENSETVKRTSDFNDQFILCSKQPPHPTLVNNSKEQSTLLYDDVRDRLSSFSSQRTIDSEDGRSSLHALSDEQLGHLTSVYYPFSSETDLLWLCHVTEVITEKVARSKSSNFITITIIITHLDRLIIREIIIDVYCVIFDTSTTEQTMNSNANTTVYPSMLLVDHESNPSLRVFEPCYSTYSPHPMPYSDYPPPGSKTEALDYPYWPPMTTHNLLANPPPSAVLDQMTIPSSSCQPIDTVGPVSSVHASQNNSPTTISSTHHHHHIHQHLYPQSSTSPLPPTYHEPSAWLGSGDYQALQAATNSPSYRHYPAPCSLYPPNHFYDPSQAAWISPPILKFESSYSPPPSYFGSLESLNHCPEAISKEEASESVAQPSWSSYQSSPTQLTPVPPKNPLNGKTRTRDKYRIVYTDQQRCELENEFGVSKYITIPRKSALSLTLALSERQIKIWFQNRRAKERKLNKKRPDASSTQGLNHSNGTDSPSDGGFESPNYYPDYT